MDTFTKNFIATRYFLIGAGFTKAISAMEFAKGYHTGSRKGGQPEFSHQIEIVMYLRTLRIPTEMLEDVICAGFLHDVCEDYDVSFSTIENLFGTTVMEAVKALTKIVDGAKLTNEQYFTNIRRNPIAAVVKGADRIHNQGSMVGVFNMKKQVEYLNETKNYILPAIKAVRKENAELEAAFENIKLMLKSQIFLVEQIHEAVKA